MRWGKYKLVLSKVQKRNKLKVFLRLEASRGPEKHLSQTMSRWLYSWCITCMYLLNLLFLCKLAWKFWSCIVYLNTPYHYILAYASHRNFRPCPLSWLTHDALISGIALNNPVIYLHQIVTCPVLQAPFFNELARYTLCSLEGHCHFLFMEKFWGRLFGRQVGWGVP